MTDGPASVVSASRSGPSPAITSGTPAISQAAIATATPFSGASRETTSALPVAEADEPSANSRITWGTTNASPTGAPSSCSRCSENRLGTTNASTSDAILGCQAAIPAA